MKADVAWNLGIAAGAFSAAESRRGESVEKLSGVLTNSTYAECFGRELYEGSTMSWPFILPWPKPQKLQHLKV